jgi:signal transduction histidine kinase
MRRFSRVTWVTLAGYMLLVGLVFAVISEFGLRRSLQQSADLINSLLGMYADPAGAPDSVAPAMLADQLVGMGEPFAITRTTTSADGMPTVYYLSPSMPAKRLGEITASTPEGLRRQVLDALTERTRWRYRVLHQSMGEFDIYVVGSRVAFLLGFGGLAAGAVLLLPLAALASRRSARRAVANTLLPLQRVADNTARILPEDLSQRITTPTGQRDVTELAAAINSMLNRVEHAHRTLESFTADASHELRTPLTHIRARAQWCLGEKRGNDELQDAVAAIQREVERTTKTIDDLLTIARGENRQLAVDREEFDLSEVIHEVQEITEAMASGRDLEVSSSADSPVLAVGDVNRTRQVLLNLASNAVRYTPSGAVRFAAAQSHDRVAASVHDTGLGIPPEQMDRIFDRFYRGDSSRSRELGGAGLGLTIAKVLAELQGGSIEVTSRSNQGSQFTLWLPRSNLRG